MKMKKWLAALFAVVVMLVMLPTAAFAMTADGGVETEDELVAAINAGGDVKLGASITITTASRQFKISGTTVTLDLNGFALTREGESSTDLFYINNGGSLTINDSQGGGSITSSYPVQLMSNSTFILNGGDITSPKGSVIDIYDGVSNVLVEMNGGSIKGAADNTFGIRGSSNVKVNIKGGVISSVPGNRLAMYISGSNDNAIEINFTSGLVTAEAKAIQAYSGAVINVSGDASIHSDSRVAISTQSGYGVVELNVTGGSITTDGPTSYAVQAQESSKVNIEGGTISGGTGIRVSETADVQISGGKIEGSKEPIGIDSGDTPTVNVTGGEFNKDVAKYISQDVTVAKFTSADETAYVVGGTIAKKAASALEGDKFEIISGDIELTDVPDGVSFTNSGKGSVSVNGVIVANNEEIVTHTHVLTHVEETPATCVAGGNIEYWYCAGCGSCFGDEACTNEITYAATRTEKLPNHTAGTEWKSDAESHWNVCVCGEIMNKAAHEFKWVTDKEATATEAGSHHEECAVCGYAKAAVEIPATGGSNIEAPDTGDNSNIVLWASVMLVAGVAMVGIFVYSRKRNENC